jgi:surface carbohydrate biosynthesis protein
MANTNVPVIIPVENQVREFDPKLLLACVAARRGFPAVIGSRREIDFRIAALPRGFYLSKSMTVRSVKMFRILRLLGHEVLAWDEEALVHPPPEVYYSRRLSPVAMPYISRLLAWGEDNLEVLRGYPHLGDTPIHITGNPRNDFLRPELRGLFAEQATAYRDTYGEFLLVNTNFNQVNSFYPAQNILLPAGADDAEPQFGRAARGMSRDYALGLRNHKQALFDHFQRLIPALAQRFPRLTIVVRPHPTENPDIYRRIASACTRVHVTNEGNVVPWLLAATALVHNGCTTGVEAYVLRVPAVSYRPCVDDRYDDGFYRLPNRASHQCFSLEELTRTLQRIVAGELGAADGAERTAMVAHYLAAQDGPLAAERIVTLLAELLSGTGTLPRPTLVHRIDGRWQAARRRWGKKWKGRKAGAQTALEFHRHRFPDLSLHAVQARLARIQQALHDTTPLVVEPVADEIFCVRLRDVRFEARGNGRNPDPR